MKKTALKKLLACLCMMALILCQFASISSLSAFAEDVPLTFADFGLDDGMVYNDVATDVNASWSGFTSVDDLAGKSFEGYVTLSQEASLDGSVRLFGAGNGGIGIRSRGLGGLAICSYYSNGAYRDTIAETEGNPNFNIDFGSLGYAEFKLYIKIKSFSGDDADLLIKLDDKVLFEGTAGGLKAVLGSGAYIIAAAAPVGVRSVVIGNTSDAELTNITFRNFSNSKGDLRNSVNAAGDGYGYHYSDGDTVVGTLFTGEFKLGVGSARNHSIRIGGRNALEGIGFFAKAKDDLRLFHYNNSDYGGESLVSIKGNDFGFSDLDEEYVKVELAFRNIINTDHVELTVSVNDKEAYKGVIANGNTILGKEMLIYAISADIGVKSVSTDVDSFDITFADFGLDDGTVYNDVATDVNAALSGYTSVDDLEGKSFAGYITLPQESSLLGSVRLFGAGNGGIGIRSRGLGGLAVCSYYSNGAFYDTIVETEGKSDFNIDFGSKGSAEFKLYIKIKSFSDNNVDLLIKLDDKVLFDGTVAGLKAVLGLNAYILADAAPVGVRSIVTEQVSEAVLTDITFSNFSDSTGSLQDSTKPCLGGYGYHYADGNDLVGTLFTGEFKLGVGSARNHSIRIGGKNALEGIGFFAKAKDDLRLFHYNSEYGGESLVSIKGNDFGFSDLDEEYVKVEMAFRAIVNTDDIQLTVRVNNKAAYMGIIANGKTVLGKEMLVYAISSDISVKSVANQIDFREVTFADFGKERDEILPNHQIPGEMTGFANMDCVAFTGKLIFTGISGSFRIGTKHLKDGWGWNGIGIAPSTDTQMSLYNYSGFDNGTVLANIDIDSCGITYEQGVGYSEFTFRVETCFVGTQDVKVMVYINGIKVYSDIIAGLQSTLGKGMRFNVSDDAVYYSSVSDSFTEVTLSDFGLGDLDLTNIDRIGGTLPNKFTSMDGLTFISKVKLGIAPGTEDWEHGVYVGTKISGNGTGFRIYPKSTSQFGIWKQFGEGFWDGSSVASFDIADCGVEYFSETNSFSEFDLKMSFRFVGTNDVKLIVSINDYEVYNDTVSDMQDCMGTALVVYATRSPISVKSIAAGKYFSRIDTVKKYFNSYFAADASDNDSFVEASLEDYWTVENEIIARKSDAVTSATENVGMIVLKNRAYKNFDLSIQYYQGEGVNESLILGIGASKMGEYFNGGEGNYAFAVAGREVLGKNLFGLNRDEYVAPGWHTLRIAVTGGLVKSYIDNSDSFDVIVLPSNYDGGYVYLSAGSNQSQFKDLTITPISDDLDRIGDVNGDNAVNMNDVLRIKKHLAEIATDISSMQAADFDNDNDITVTDLTYICTYILKGRLQANIDNGIHLDSGVMPVCGFLGPIDDYITDENYAKIAECGINTVVRTPDYYTNRDDCEEALNLADKYNISCIVTDSRVMSNLTDEQRKELLADYNAHESFAGIFVADEPYTEYYLADVGESMPISQCKDIATSINDISGISAYVNLFPYYSNLHGYSINDYKNYVQEYCDSVPNAKYISYDHYAFDVPTGNGYDFNTYFSNMAVIRDAAKAMGIPFWAFIRNQHQGIDFTEGEYQWNVNTSLAMGAKGISYYTLISKSAENTTDFMIYDDATTTTAYTYAKNINAQIANIDEILMNSENVGIIAIGTQALADTADVDCRIDSFNELTGVTASNGALVGCFTYNNKTALYVVNYDMANSQDITLQLNAAKNLTKYTTTTESIEASASHTFTLGAGAAALFVIE